MASAAAPRVAISGAAVTRISGVVVEPGFVGISMARTRNDYSYRLKKHTYDLHWIKNTLTSISQTSFYSDDDDGAAVAVAGGNIWDAARMVVDRFRMVVDRFAIDVTFHSL